MLYHIRWRIAIPFLILIFLLTFGLRVYVSSLLRGVLPKEIAEVSIAQLHPVFLLATAVGMVLTLIIATILSTRIVWPIRDLTNAIRRIAAGKSARHLVSRQDEVGELTLAYNLMAENLRTHIETLETEREKLVAVLRQMTNGVLMVDSEGRVGLLNVAAEQMFGVREAESLGHSLVEVLRHYRLVELWQQCRDTGELQMITLELSLQGLYLQAIATPLGEVLAGHTLLLFQDLTQVRHLETVRQDFISNISHELRTPVASLKALTETLLDGALRDPPAARRFLTRIDTEVDALALMVQELLELSRIESGRVPLEFQPISPCKLLTAAFDRLMLQADRARLQISLNCDSDLPFVLADPPRVEQVLVNLLHNAIKFTPAVGQIDLRAQLGTDKVIFQVKDTGVGISDDILPRIFERFFKADRARSASGTGLGLSIARHIVEAHRGRIWAESVIGQGSTFFFSLPVD